MAAENNMNLNGCNAYGYEQVVAPVEQRADDENATQAQQAAVVVDPYSSGKYLLIELDKRQIPIICVRSSTKCSQQFLRSHEANSVYFSEMIDFEELTGLDHLVEKVRALPYTVIGVFGGSEPGVELADLLGNALGLPNANSLDLLDARKDKAEMQECLRRNGLPAAAQFKSGNLDDLMAWALERGEWPLVAKPTGGAGSDGVYFCRSENDLKVAHNAIIGNRNATGTMNNELALQEFLNGDEYIVDTVSHEGKHICVAIWVYTKKRGMPWDEKAICSCQNNLLQPEGEEQDRLVDYVFKALDAVGLRHGPCHTEVMLTPRGPILVEVNARLHGLQGPRLIELATGTSKATYAADAIIGGGKMFKACHSQDDNKSGRYLYPLQKQCTQMVLHCNAEGYLTASIRDSIAALELPSVVEILPAVEVGQYINKTRDLPTSAGTVLMVHESQQQIQDDTLAIRNLEESGRMYLVSETPLPSSPPCSPRRRALSDDLSELEKEPASLHSLEKADDLYFVMNELEI